LELLAQRFLRRLEFVGAMLRNEQIWMGDPSKEQACSRLSSGIVGSNLAEGMDVHIVCVCRNCLLSRNLKPRQPRPNLGCSTTKEEEAT
jgi:hypothetical protein